MNLPGNDPITMAALRAPPGCRGWEIPGRLPDSKYRSLVIQIHSCPFQGSRISGLEALKKPFANPFGTGFDWPIQKLLIREIDQSCNGKY